MKNFMKKSEIMKNLKKSENCVEKIQKKHIKLAKMAVRKDKNA